MDILFNNCAFLDCSLYAFLKILKLFFLSLGTKNLEIFRLLINKYNLLLKTCKDLNATFTFEVINKDKDPHIIEYKENHLINNSKLQELKDYQEKLSKLNMCVCVNGDIVI